MPASVLKETSLPARPATESSTRMPTRAPWIRFESIVGPSDRWTRMPTSDCVISLFPTRDAEFER